MQINSCDENAVFVSDFPIKEAFKLNNHYLRNRIKRGTRGYKEVQFSKIALIESESEFPLSLLI